MITYYLKKELPPFLVAISFLIGFGFGKGEWLYVSYSLAGALTVLAIVVFFKRLKDLNIRLNFAERENHLNFAREATTSCKMEEYKWKYNHVLKGRSQPKFDRKRTNKAWKKRYKKKYQL